MTKRATIEKDGSVFKVLVDGVYVGRGVGHSQEKECIALRDELNASDEKCDTIKAMFQEETLITNRKINCGTSLIQAQYRVQIPQTARMLHGIKVGDLVEVWIKPVKKGD